MRLEGLNQFKNPMTSSGIEPATFLQTIISLTQIHLSMTGTKRRRRKIYIYKAVPVTGREGP
jgi:hypothetical protein